MDRTVGIEDVAGVQSRVSWGAVFGGSTIALSVYLLLGLFFAGVGLSLNRAGVEAGNAAIVSIVAGVLSIVVALWCGGCVTSILTAGETRREAIIHGVLTWAVVTGFTLAMVGMGLRTGYNALLGAALVGQNGERSWQQAARDNGIPPERINQLERDLNLQNAQAQANNPENREQVSKGAMIATWSVFAGTLLSIGAAVLGGLSGMGPTFRLFPGVVATAERREVTVTRT
jgi:Kef-type K+ transport system membrane component KefB